MTAGLASASQLWRTNVGEQAGKLLGIAAIGGLFGPVLGGVLFTWGEATAFLVLAYLTLAVGPEVLLAIKDIRGPSENASSTVSVRIFFDDPILFRVGVLLAITTVATGALEAGVPLFLDDSLGLSSAEIGGVLLVMVLMHSKTLSDHSWSLRTISACWIMLFLIECMYYRTERLSILVIKHLPWSLRNVDTNG